ncbi:MAG: carbon-nitrogen hydrolase family protein [Lentisphaeria bacterium]|jgi:nitrilase|nr:carbon-nitrogen hydrolase family protein [Lentisphaeria bacterium]
MTKASPTAGDLRLGLVQTCSGPDVAANIAMVRDRLGQVRSEGADLALFPEYVFCLAGMTATRSASRPDQEWCEVLAGLCRGAGLAAVFGGVPVAVDDGLVNRSYAIDADGAVLARYDKRRLFTLQGKHPEAIFEPALFRPGHDAVTFVSHGWRIGLTICFDLRFPEVFAACRPCDLLVCTAAFTAWTGQAHWEVLLRARAIENLTWVAGVGQGGVNQVTGLELYGHSAVYDPWGLPIAVAPHRDPQCFTVTLRRERLAECRGALGIPGGHGAGTCSCHECRA